MTVAQQIDLNRRWMRANTVVLAIDAACVFVTILMLCAAVAAHTRMLVAILSIPLSFMFLAALWLLRRTLELRAWTAQLDDSHRRIQW